METDSRDYNENDDYGRNDALTSQIRELYGRIVYTHKTHEKCADIINDRNTCFKTLQLTLSVLTTTSLLSRIFTGQDWVIWVAALFSAVQFGVTTYLKEYDLGKLAQRHAEAALDLLDVRETYLSILTDLHNKKISYVNAILLRDELQTKTNTIYKSAPRTFHKAFAAASRALKEQEEFTFSEKELDKFVPEILRKGKS